jgi:hypothetical protein
MLATSNEHVSKLKNKRLPVETVMYIDKAEGRKWIFFFFLLLSLSLSLSLSPITPTSLTHLRVSDFTAAAEAKSFDEISLHYSPRQLAAARDYSFSQLLSSKTISCAAR